LGSVLQYIEDWRDILLKLFKYESRYLLLEDIFTGTIPQFVTVQEFFSNKIPFQFINIEDLIKFINDSQYKIISISDCIPIINNKEMFYDMSDFPSELRIDRTKSFILKNKY
jgi:putative methyltransferase (TIGR04325 family)